VRRREDNAPPQPGPGPEFVEDPPPSPESLRGECIEEIQEGLGLDDRAIGAVFGVSERTIEEWRRHGVPAAHVDTLRRLEKQNRSARRRAQRTS
jgi:DNA-binding transcriptional regulator YiaG